MDINSTFGKIIRSLVLKEENFVSIQPFVKWASGKRHQMENPMFCL